MANKTAKDPGVVLLRAWLLPGAGHWYIGRRGRAAVYAACVLGVFLAGLAMGPLTSVSVCQHKWAFLLQLFDGPISIVAAVVSHAADAGIHAALAAGDGGVATGAVLDVLGGPSRLTDLGLTFTLVSAAFNVLVMADAYYLADKTEDEAA